MLSTEKNPEWQPPETEQYPDYSDPMPDYVFSMVIKDERFSDYEFPGYFLESEMIGEKTDEIAVEYCYGYEVYPVQAEVYTVKGAPQELSVCLRFIDDCEENFVDELILFGEYYVLWSKSYSFESFAGMRQVLSDGGRLYVGEWVGYYLDTSGDYCKSFHMTEEIANRCAQLLSTIDGEGIDNVSAAMLGKVASEAKESNL